MTTEHHNSPKADEARNTDQAHNIDEAHNAEVARDTEVARRAHAARNTQEALSAPGNELGNELGIAVLAPKLSGPVMSAQSWRQLTFLHWSVRPADIEQFFPAGTRPDVIDGVSYVGLIPFQMDHAGPGPGWPVPYFGKFAETNVRLYSVDEEGRHGIVFRSLETQRLAIVGLTRAGLGLNYTWARMNLSRYDNVITYQSARRWPERGLTSRISVRIGEPLTPDRLQVWLTARWGLHTRVAGRSVWIPNEHEPWPLQQAEVLEINDELLTSSGVSPIGFPLSAMYSSGVYTRFGWPVLL